MADTTFVDNTTVIEAAWLNDLNDFYYTLFNSATTAALARTALGLVISTDVQAQDAGLSDIAGLAVTDGNVIVGDGANWVAESGATARTSLGAAGLTDANVFTKTQTWTKGSDVSNAATITLGDGNIFDVGAGATPVTAIASKGVGTFVILQFDGVCTLTHSAADLILPGGANITTAAGDVAALLEYATGDWYCVSYQRKANAPYDGLLTSDSAGYFQSSDQTFANSTLFTLPHGLGSTPRLIIVGLRCTVANGGYAVGDELFHLNAVDGAGSDTGISIAANGTNVFVVTDNNVQFITLTSPARRTVLASEWDLFVRAWL